MADENIEITPKLEKTDSSSSVESIILSDNTGHSKKYKLVKIPASEITADFNQGCDNSSHNLTKRSISIEPEINISSAVLEANPEKNSEAAKIEVTKPEEKNEVKCIQEQVTNIETKIINLEKQMKKMMKMVQQISYKLINDDDDFL